MKATIHHLPNGLTAILRESHTAPVVALQVWVGVGSADETPKQSGTAHALEHMLFKGTSRRGVGEIARDIERAGGQVNAWTSHDETVLHVTTASRFAELGLDVIADAVLNARIDAGELRREIEVIREEIRMGRDAPSRVVIDKLFGELFRRHPYGRPVIGRERSVRRLTSEAVRRFHRRWYTPTNMVLVAVGDFRTERMLAQIEETLGAVPGGREVRRPRREPEPIPRRLRFAAESRPISEAHLALGFPIPGLTHEDVPALDLLCAVIGQGASSRLEREVRRGPGLANDVRAMSYTPVDGGMLVVYTIAPLRTLSRATEAIVRQLARAIEEPIAPREIEKARTMLRSDAIYAEETVDGAARKLGFYGLHARDIGYEERYLAGLTSAGPAELMEAARRYLVPSAATISTVVPGEVESLDREDRRAAPVDSEGEIDIEKLRDRLSRSFLASWGSGRSPARSVSAARTEIRKLESGDTLIVRSEPSSRVAAVRVAFPGGLRLENTRRAGESQLLASSLTRGTLHRDADEIAAAMDDMAGSISGFSGNNTFGVQAELLARHLDEGISLMGECLRQPAFDEGEVGRERELLLEELRSLRDTPDRQAMLLFQRALFGSHPYARSALGSEETLSRVESADLRRSLRRLSGAGRMVAAIAGPLDADRAVELTEQHLAARPGKRGRAPAGPKPWSPPRHPRYEALSLYKEQSHLVIGFPGTTLDAEDRFALDVLVELLGGHGGRLFGAVREKRSLAYAVTALSMEGIEPGYVAIYAATAPGQEAALVEAALGEVRELAGSAPSRDELRRVQRHLIGAREIGRQRAAVRAAGMALGHLYGIGHDADERYPERLGELKAGDVREAAERYLVPERMAVTCAGPNAEKLNIV